MNREDFMPEFVEVNPGPWHYDLNEHCIIDAAGNVVAEVYEDDINGLVLVGLFNKFFDEQNKNKIQIHGQLAFEL